MKKIFIILVLITLAALAIGFWRAAQKDEWTAFPDGIIVDTPEEFQQKNTP